jgi:hypothetical protein
MLGYYIRFVYTCNDRIEFLCLQSSQMHKLFVYLVHGSNTKQADIQQRLTYDLAITSSEEKALDSTVFNVQS